MPRTPEQVLRSIVADVEAMQVRVGEDRAFGPLDILNADANSAVVYWPNLAALIDEAKGALAPISVSTPDAPTTELRAIMKELESIEEQLADWLTDNTHDVFEEEPEVDDARGSVQDAIAKLTERVGA